MQHLRPGVSTEAFFAYAAAAPTRVLLLDYDGTLAGFQKQREAAFPYAGVRERLTAIQQLDQTRLVIVSGRRVSEVQQLLGLDQTPEIWGSHGRERRLPDGTMISIPVDQGAVDALNAARAAVVQHQFSERMEDKISSIALHWRGLSDALRQGIQTTMQAAWEPIATTYGLEIHDFDNGMELRVPGRNKGDAVTTILSEVEPQAAVAYLGDDRTDEDAFIALHQHAKVTPAMSTHPWYLTVLVRNEHRETAADIWIRPPEELLSFLDHWRKL